MDFLKNKKIFSILVALGLLLVAFVAVKTYSEFKGLRYIGGGVSSSSTISFSGIGEISASPDIAKVNFTVREEAKTAKEAETKVATKTNSIVKSIKESKIAEKDIKTESYNSYPKYEFQYDNNVICGEFTCPPRPTKQVITGYEVSQNISITIRDLDNVSKTLDILSTGGASDISGPNFDIDNKDTLEAEARRLAIEDAKKKAKVLAKDLGVRLIRVVSFSEGGYGGPVPYMAEFKALSADTAAAPLPEIPQGENKIISNVTITYEIR